MDVVQIYLKGSEHNIKYLLSEHLIIPYGLCISILLQVILKKYF